MATAKRTEEARGIWGGRGREMIDMASEEFGGLARSPKG